MKVIIWMSIFFCFLSSVLSFGDITTISANVSAAPEEKLAQEKSKIRKILEKLKKEGKINDTDYLQSLKEINEMTIEKMDSIKKKALDFAKDHPLDLEKFKNGLQIENNKSKEQ